MLEFKIAVCILRAFDRERSGITCLEGKYVSQLHHKCIYKIGTHPHLNRQRHAEPRVHPIGFLLDTQNGNYSTQINVSLTNCQTIVGVGLEPNITALKGQCRYL